MYSLRERSILTIRAHKTLRNQKPLAPIVAICGYCLIVDLFPIGSAGAAPFAPGDDGSQHRVTVSLDVTGNLLLQPGSGDRETLPMTVAARFDYDERIVSAQRPIVSARNYRVANADIRVGRGAMRQTLPQQMQYFLFESDDDPRNARLQIRRPDGALSAEQAELLEVPVESAAINALVVDADLERVGNHWEPRNDHIATLFGMDAITQNSLVCRYYRSDGERALIHVKGDLMGSVHGVASEMSVDGTVDISSASGKVSAAALTIHEKRSIGQARPGFDVTANVEIQITPSINNRSLPDSLLASWDIGRDTTGDILTFESTVGHYRLLHHRSWNIISDLPRAAVLRLVDRGDLIAQCNITRLQDLGQGRVSLNEFKRDVQAAIAKQAGEIVDATETNDDDRHVLRIVASGVVSEVSLQWIYYHVTDAEGRRVAMVISVESELFERFAEADQLLVESIELSDIDPSDTSGEISPDTPPQSTGSTIDESATNGDSDPIR